MRPVNLLKLPYCIYCQLQATATCEHLRHTRLTLLYQHGAAATKVLYLESSNKPCWGATQQPCDGAVTLGNDSKVQHCFQGRRKPGCLVKILLKEDG